MPEAYPLPANRQVCGVNPLALNSSNILHANSCDMHLEGHKKKYLISLSIPPLKKEPHIISLWLSAKLARFILCRNHNVS